VRKGKQFAVEVALRSAPQAGKDDVRNLSGAHPFDGARVANILPGTAEELGIDEQEGVVILQVRPDSKAARIGFQPGDIIQQVGRKKIEAVTELEAVLKERQQVWLVVLKRGNQSVRLQLAG
jgi:S1-C subfamily serine protease